MKNIFLFYKKITKNKFIEIELLYDKQFTNYFLLSLIFSKRIDHPGLYFKFEIGPIIFNLCIIDNRHWNYETDNYMEA